MIKYFRLLVIGSAVTAAITSAGCASFSPKQVVEPSTITLENGLKSIGTGLAGMLKAGDGNKYGLVPAEIEVTFNLAAKADDAANLHIDLSKNIAGASNASTLGASKEEKSSGERGNTITIKFVNLLTLNKETLAQNKSPDDIKKLITVWVDSGMDILRAPPPKVAQ